MPLSFVTTMSNIILIILYLISTTLPHPTTCYTQHKTSISEKQFIGQNITIAVGAKDFKDLIINSDIFVDKTLLIKELLENPSNHSIITYPRRTGKTINLHMLKNFLEIQVDENAVPISPHNSTSNYRLFKYGELVTPNQTYKLKNPLCISNEESLFEKYQGKWPVIYVDFGNIDNVMLKENLVKCVNNSIINAFRQHSYMMNVFQRTIESENVTQSAKRNASRRLKLFREIVNDEDIKNNPYVLNHLSEILSEHFNKSVYILIDGYDIFRYRRVNFNFFFTKSEKNLTSFIFSLLNQTIERNVYYKKAIFTGIFQLRDVIWRLWYDKPQKYNLYNRRLSAFYGFTNNEAEALFDYTAISNTLRNKARLWYNGYKIGVETDQRFYNPWSLASFINTKKISKYWSDAPATDIVFYLFESAISQVRFRHFILPLVLGKCLLLDDDKLKFTYEELEIMTELICIPAPDARICNFVMTHFWAYGYLTLCDGSCGIDTTVKLRIPNQEVMEKFVTGISRYYYRKKFNITSGTFNIAIKHLIEFFEDDRTYSESVKTSLKSIFDRIAFHPLLPGRTAFLVKDAFEYIVARIKCYHNYQTEIPPGNDAPDLILYKKNRGIVLQATSNRTSPQNALEMAKHYKNAFKGVDSIRTIKYIGFNVPTSNEISFLAELENVTYTELL